MCTTVPPSGGSLEIGNYFIGLPQTTGDQSSPFGGIPRNWKRVHILPTKNLKGRVPPSGGSLEIGNRPRCSVRHCK